MTRVSTDEQGLYGRDYWFGYQQQDIGLPDIRTRARADLPGRCVHWLRTVLKYMPPPARVQELGSAQDGFVALLPLAGYDAAGLELSPWIVDYARQTFEVPVLQGPLEQQAIAPGALDVLALMDVLECLPHPIATMRHAVNLLQPKGELLIQTQMYVEGTSYQELVARGNHFLHHMNNKQEEHLFLFSRTAARELFHRVGCQAMQFEPAIFSQHDMYFAAGRETLNTRSVEQTDAALSATPGGRLALALGELPVRGRGSSGTLIDRLDLEIPGPDIIVRGADDAVVAVLFHDVR